VESTVACCRTWHELNWYSSKASVPIWADSVVSAVYIHYEQYSSLVANCIEWLQILRCLIWIAVACSRRSLVLYLLILCLFLIHHLLLLGPIIELTSCYWNYSSRWSWLKLTLAIHLKATLWTCSKISCPCVFSRNLTKVGSKFTPRQLYTALLHTSLWMIGDKVYCSDRHDLPLFLHVRCQLTLCCTYMIIIRQWCCFGTCTIVILWKQSSMPNYLCVWHMFSIAHFLQECYGCIFEIFLWDRNSSNFSPFYYLLCCSDLCINAYAQLPFV